MNILLINHYAGSPIHGMQYRPYHLAKLWKAAGKNPTVVGCSETHLHTKKPVVCGKMTEEVIDGIPYVWVKAPKYSGNGPMRVLNLLVFAARLWWLAPKLAKKAQGGGVIASSPHPFIIYPARRIAALSGAKLIFEIRDLWPLTFSELDGMSKRHPFYLMVQAAENYACRHADRVVSLLPNASSYLELHGMRKEKFACIPNGVDPEEWSRNDATLPAAAVTFFAQLRSEGRTIVGYAGAHGLANALENLVNAADVLQDEKFAFVFVGQGPAKAQLAEFVAKQGIKNCHFMDPIPKKSVPALLAQLDIAYIGLKSTKLFRFGISPNKLMDYMMAGKPVIQAIDAGNDLVTESRCGITVPPGDPEALVAALRQIAALSPGQRLEMGLRGKEFVLKHYDNKLLAQKYVGLIGERNHDIEERQ